MAKIKVWQSHPPNESGLWADWEMECPDHPGSGRVTSTEWLWAMEAAWGHLAMHHGGLR